MFVIVLIWLLLILIFISIILYVPYNKVTLKYSDSLVPLTPTTVPGDYILDIDDILKNTNGYLQITLFTTETMTFTSSDSKVILKKGYNTFVVPTPCDTFRLTKKGKPIVSSVLWKEIGLYYK